jgi:hypothetical protein
MGQQGKWSNSNQNVKISVSVNLIYLEQQQILNRNNQIKKGKRK